MTQPSGPNQTFDTSLIDTQQTLNRSFSSTETNTSGSSTNHKQQPSNLQSANVATMSEPQPFTAVTNDQLYDTWASTYDTDGNVLQAVDDLELKTLLPKFVDLVSQANSDHGDENEQPLRILDFGCGTGRNLVKLLPAAWEGSSEVIEVHGWDASAGMLEIARRKGAGIAPAGGVRLAELRQMDFSDSDGIPIEYHGKFEGMISTLVLEHLPLQPFFATLSVLLAPGGYALITNMHPDMGRTTKAGYKTASGERVKGESYVYDVEESVSAAREAGLEVMGSVTERAVDEGMIERGEVGERGRKWVGVGIWFGFIVRKRDG